MKLPELNLLEESIQSYSRKELDQLMISLLSSSTSLLEELRPLVEIATQSKAINGLVKQAIDYNNKFLELVEEE